jgi:hypothetical protein
MVKSKLILYDVEVEYNPSPEVKSSINGEVRKSIKQPNLDERDRSSQ